MASATSTWATRWAGGPTTPACYVDGKVDYQRVRAQPFFQAGIARLENAFAQQRRIVLMCSEGRPEECHRARLIGEALDVLHVPVVHIDENDALVAHAAVIQRLTDGQLSLFGQEEFTSRKRYAPSGEEETKDDCLNLSPSASTTAPRRRSFRHCKQPEWIPSAILRRRRGVRGAAYAFANAVRLEARLTALGIRYRHAWRWRPAQPCARQQAESDAASHVAKRQRAVLSPPLSRPTSKNAWPTSTVQPLWPAWDPSPSRGPLLRRTGGGGLPSLAGGGPAGTGAGCACTSS